MNSDYLDGIHKALNATSYPTDEKVYTSKSTEEIKELIRKFKASGVMDEFNPETGELIETTTELNRKQRKWLIKVLEDNDERITSIQMRTVKKVLIENEYTEAQKSWLDDIRRIYEVKENR